jgi:hypothetical protein
MSDCDRTLLMRKRYGNGNGICKDCPHLVKQRYNKTYYKCLAYGDSSSTATDWRIHYIACGLKTKELPERTMMQTKKHFTKIKERTVLDGQIGMEVPDAKS